MCVCVCVCVCVCLLSPTPLHHNPLNPLAYFPLLHTHAHAHTHLFQPSGHFQTYHTPIPTHTGMHAQVLHTRSIELLTVDLVLPLYMCTHMCDAYLYLHVCVRVCAYWCIITCVCVHIYMCMHTCVCVCVCVCAYLVVCVAHICV